MFPVHRVVLAALSIFAFAAAPGASAAEPISGKLSKPGYTVIALGSNEKADAVRVKRRAFKVRPPGKRVSIVTLQLRAPDGVYAGPVVVATGGKGKRAILGLKPGAELGRIIINAAKGFGKVKGGLPQNALVTKSYARAKRGVPIGAGRYGRVRSRSGSAPGDLDVDGIPDLLDVDDDGDLILDRSDIKRGKGKGKRKKKARAAYVWPSGTFLLFSDLDVGFSQTVNANTPGIQPSQLEAALPSFGTLIMGIHPPYNRAELDCAQPQDRSDPTLGGLVYCSKGGTGKVFGPPPALGFPDCCDPDNDGFGTLVDQQPLPGAHAMFLNHGATSAQIGTGDLLVQRVGGGGDFIATLQYVFATTPALVSYSDTAGNCARVSGMPGACPTVFSYPGPPGQGEMGSGFPVAAPAGQDVIATFTFWRPQRRPIVGERGYSEPPTAWTDIGGLKYGASVAGQDPGSNTCEQEAYSSADPNLTPDSPTAQPGGGGFRDTAADQPANPANTFSYTLNLTKCFASKGLSFNPGEERGFDFRAVAAQTDADDNAGVSIFFERQ